MRRSASALGDDPGDGQAADGGHDRSGGRPVLLQRLYELTGSGGWQNASGAVGIAVAALALYSVWALQLEEETHSTLLPTLRRGAGKDAVAGGGAEQVDSVVNEAGVRRQL